MAIIYSYPTATPASGDLIVGTDITGKVTKNFTVGSIVSTEIPNHITGTTNTVPLFTGANTIGNSIINQNAGGDKVFIGGELDVSGSFTVDNAGDTVLSVNPASGVFSIGDTEGLGDGVYITNSNTSFLDIYGNGALRFRMNADGDVGIGTSTPTRKLDVVDTRTSLSGVTSASPADAVFNTINLAHTADAPEARCRATVSELVNSSSFSSLVNTASRSTAKATGSGDIAALYGASNWSIVEGTGNYTYSIGGLNWSKIDNPSATVANVSGTHSEVQLAQGTVGNINVCDFDFDQSAGTTITGDFNYINVKNESPINISGTARALNIESTLPSYLAGDVGIGVAAPQRELHVNGSVRVADSLEVGSTSQATGSTSLAAGSNTTASGESSTAMGYETTASGNYSTASGISSNASGMNSVAMGYLTTASGENSMAIGYGSIASGTNSFAGGGNDVGAPGGIAYGSNSFAFGSNAKAGENSGNISGDIAIGFGCEADGGNSVALGNNTKATNNNSFTAGVGNLASGISSTALGSVTVASGSNSFACGDNTTASGGLSFASGKGNVASGDGSIVMGGIGTGISTAAGTASSVFGGLRNTANGINSTIVGGQKNNIDVNSSDSGIIGGEDNEMTAGSTNSILLGGIGLRGGGINQTVVGVANVSRNDAKFIVGVGEYTDPTAITRENAFVVKDDGQIVLDQYTSNDFLSNTYTFPVLNLDGSGKINKGNLVDMLPEVPPEMKNTSYTFQSGSNLNLGASTKGIVIASWTVVGSNNPATITLPQSSNNLNKLITVVTSASFGNVGGTNILGIKPAFGDTINDTTAPNSVIYLDKAYESAEFYATSDGWIMLRKTIV